MPRIVYGVLGEDESDKETIHVLLRRLAKDPGLTVRGRNFKGRGNLLNGGARELRTLHAGGCERFVVCLDSDGDDPVGRRDEAEARIVRGAGVPTDCCIVVAVRAIESWILADIDAAIVLWKKHPTWRPGEVKNPEALAEPKKELVRLSKAGGGRPKYEPPADNPMVARHLNLDRVAAKCPSFHPLRDFVREGVK